MQFQKQKKYQKKEHVFIIIKAKRVKEEETE